MGIAVWRVAIGRVPLLLSPVLASYGRHTGLLPHWLLGLLGISLGRLRGLLRRHLLGLLRIPLGRLRRCLGLLWIPLRCLGRLLGLRRCSWLGRRGDRKSVG